MRNEFQRVAIVNRGESAMRLIHAVREFNEERGTALRTIALFTEPDRHAMFVREADESVLLGPSDITDPSSHHLKTSYADCGDLARAISSTRAEAMWVGWDFAAEHAPLADLCSRMGIVFIGPTADMLRSLSDKISFRQLAAEAQMPVVPWSDGPVETLGEAYWHGERLGYPLLVKPRAGGNGQCIRTVLSESELESAFEVARAEAFAAFGDPTVFLEQQVNGVRRVEVQIIADHHGTTWAIDVRDRTIQRRHQVILQEAPSPVLAPEQDRWLRDAAIRLSQAIGYRNAGWVTFLYRPENKKFFLLEMNADPQVEHPPTGYTTSVDLVKLQLHVASGGSLEIEPPRSSGHTVEVWLNAEDPENGFARSACLVERLRIATGPGVLVDNRVEEGEVVGSELSPTIARIIAHGGSRKAALSRLHRVLRDSIIVTKDGANNRGFLTEVLGRPEVQNATADTDWVDRLVAGGQQLSAQHVDVALVRAAIEAYDGELKVEQTQFYAAALRGRPEIRRRAGYTVELRYRDHSYSMRVCRLGLQRYQVELDGVRVEARLERVRPFECELTVFSQRSHVVCVEQGRNYRIDVNGISHLIHREDRGMVRAPSPSVVVSISVKPGDTVSVGDRVAVVEAMKLEMEIVAPFSGKVRQVLAMPYVQVATGTPLVQIEVAGDRTVVGSTPRVALGTASGPTEQATSPAQFVALETLRQLVLGFDVDPRQSARLLRDSMKAPLAVSDTEEMRRLEEEVLSTFVDLCSLFRQTPKAHEICAEAPSTEALLFSYLRMLDTRGAGLPADFVGALRRALAHYGVTSLNRSPQLEESLLWIYKSHQHVEQQIVPIMTVLQRRLEDVKKLQSPAGESLRTLLDRMVLVTRGVFPAVSELALELRYRCFDQPLFEDRRKQIYAEAEKHLDWLASNPECLDRCQRIRTLIECPQPLASVIAGRFEASGPGLQQVMLEVMVARYYLQRTVTNVQIWSSDGHSFLSAQYNENGKRVQLFATHVNYQQFSKTLEATVDFIAQVPAGDDVVLDFFGWKNDFLTAPQDAQKEIASIVNAVDFKRTIARIVVAVSGPGQDPGMGGMQHFTYEPSENGYHEVEFFRNVHPMMAERLHLWRLKNFKIDRLPSVEDVYLLHAVANENPKDERLFAVAEVRDLTPVRDEMGQIIQLPHLERMFAEAVDAIRSFQSKRPLNARLQWNRIFLYVWPTLELKAEEVNQIVHRLAPSTDGLGLEQVVVRVRMPNPRTGELRDTVVRISAPGDAGVLMTFRPAAKLQPMKPLTPYEQKIVKMRQRGLVYPYEIVRMLTPAQDDTRAEFPPGVFVEHDLDAEGRLIPIDRPYGENKANIIVGLIRNITTRYPEGMLRVLLLGDPSKEMGAIAEPECRRILAALDLAKQRNIPLEWFTLSAGAKISMESGVENMDWVARVLRGLIEFTQAGGEINLVVNGINVGAQPYWNAEATMLMHTRGILIMTPKAAMVLTGRRALDYSGSVSAEDNQGIGGYDRIMGFNGQAQYFARDISEACKILMRHYDHTYIEPGERFPRRVETNDPVDRDVQEFPHGDGQSNSFAKVGEIFSDAANPGRKKPFDIRTVMRAVTDQDHQPLERWSGMRSAETAVVWDAHLGGYPTCLIGIESKPITRFGFVPADGPDQWTAGTLFPLSSKKVARAINAASNNRPVVILANLSGFDGSPESMRRLQLEYGAEIGRAVVNFRGPMIFCVISRFHGGAYVVFSRALNEQLEVLALEGTYASVIGGAPAAAVVFANEVEARARKDERLQSLSQAITHAQGTEKNRLQTEWDELFPVVHSEKLGEVADEFDHVHSVHRALEVGALHDILPPRNLRPYLVEAIERGMAKQERQPQQPHSEDGVVGDAQRILIC